MVRDIHGDSCINGAVASAVKGVSDGSLVLQGGKQLRLPGGKKIFSVIDYQPLVTKG